MDSTGNLPFFFKDFAFIKSLLVNKSTLVLEIHTKDLIIRNISSSFIPKILVKMLSDVAAFIMLRFERVYDNFEYLYQN